MTRLLSVVTPPREWANHVAEVARATFLGPFESRDPFLLYVNDESNNLIALAVVVEGIDTVSGFAYGSIDKHGEIISINVRIDEDGNLIVTLP